MPYFLIYQKKFFIIQNIRTKRLASALNVDKVMHNMGLFISMCNTLSRSHYGSRVEFIRNPEADFAQLAKTIKRSKLCLGRWLNYCPRIKLWQNPTEFWIHSKNA